MSEKVHSICGRPQDPLSERHFEYFDRFMENDEPGHDGNIGVRDLAEWYREVAGKKMPEMEDNIACIYVNALFQLDNSLALARETLGANNCFESGNSHEVVCAGKLLDVMDNLATVFNPIEIIARTERQDGQRSFEKVLMPPVINSMLSRAAHLFTDVANANISGLHGIGVVLGTGVNKQTFIDHVINPDLMESVPQGAQVVSVNGIDVTTGDHCATTIAGLIDGKKGSKVKLGLYTPSISEHGGMCVWTETKRSFPIEDHYREVFDNALGKLTGCFFGDERGFSLQNLDMEDPLTARMIELGKKYCEKWRRTPVCCSGVAS